MGLRPTPRKERRTGDVDEGKKMKQEILTITENTAIARSMAWDTKIGKGLPPAPQEEEST